MNDWPTHPSILMWKLLIMIQGLGPLNCFLSTGTTITRPGLSPTSRPLLNGVETNGRRPVAVPGNSAVVPSDGVTPPPKTGVTPFDVLISMPQPISYPASRSPRGSSGPIRDPANIPL